MIFITMGMVFITRGMNFGIFWGFGHFPGNLIGRICVFLGRFGKFEYVSVA